MSLVDRLLRRPPTWRAVVLLAVTARVAFTLAPFDVLAPIDPHELGRRLLEGAVPYRDLPLEYPPGAVVAFVLPGLVPAGIAAQVLALQAVALDATVLLLLRGDRLALRRYVLLSTVGFPLLSGGFDALVLAAIAWSVQLQARGDDRSWWLAGAGAAVKLFPGVLWGTTRRWGRAGLLALGTTVAVLVLPLALGSGRSTPFGYHLDRDVQQESVAASVTYLWRRATGDPVEVVYRFRAQELVGADGAATVLLAGFGALAALLAVRCWRAERPVDPRLGALALLLAVLCGSKVLSPQLLTLAAPLVASLGGRWSGPYLLALVLTVGAFVDDAKGDAFMSTVAVRNVVLVALAIAASRELLRATRPVPAPLAGAVVAADGRSPEAGPTIGQGFGDLGP